MEPLTAVLSLTGVHIFALTSYMLHRSRNRFWVVPAGVLLTGCAHGSPRSLALIAGSDAHTLLTPFVMAKNADGDWDLA